jgi:hypothetical protein
MTRSRIAREALAGPLALWGALFTVSVRAGLVNDVPSCYVAEHMPYKPASPSHLIYVLLDQTVQLDPDLQASVLHNLDGVLGPGTKFVIAEFSAYSEGRYLSVVHTGIVEPSLPAREEGNVPLARLLGFKTCLREQQAFAVQMANQTVAAIFHGSTATLGHSDILAALDTISGAIRVEPEQVEREGYRDAQTLGALKEFWSEYLAASHADLVEFGEPALLEPVSYSKSAAAQ